MAHSYEPAHGSGGQTVFTSTEVEAFHADDRSVATAIVGLMVSIFSLGLIGYFTVCVWVGF